MGPSLQHARAMGSAPDRLKNAEQIAEDHGMHGERIATHTFQLQSWSRVRESGKVLRIYIEGDGYAWRSRSRPSWDPTPYDPLSLKLAGLDGFPEVVYLARPCQYVGVNDNANCQERYWTNARFSEEVIASMNEAVDELKKSVRAEKIELVGYSGGAAVALLIIARRDDVINLRTVAGNLDPEAVNLHHRASPLDESLDPLDFLKRVTSVPQLHFVGGRDKVVPMEIASHFISLLPEGSCADMAVVPNATHSSGWEENWEELLKRPLPCEGSSSLLQNPSRSKNQ